MTDQVGLWLAQVQVQVSFDDIEDVAHGHNLDSDLVPLSRHQARQSSSYQNVKGAMSSRN
jgi:hypothetical protein